MLYHCCDRDATGFPVVCSRVVTRVWLRAALITVASIFVSNTQGAATPYGADFVREGVVWGHQSALNTPLLREPAPKMEPSQRFREQLVEMERDQGPYAAGLYEPLSSLGQAYLQQGAHQQAAAMYRRALHVVRINEGLYSRRQVPLLRGLLAAYRASLDWDALDDRYDYYLRLSGAGQPPFTDVRLAVIDEFLRWQREALRLGLPGEKRRLLATLEMNNALLQALENDEAVAFEWRKSLAMSQLLNFYKLQQRIEPRETQAPGTVAPGYFGPPPMAADLQTQQLESWLRSAPARGVALMESLLPDARAEGPREEAHIYLVLADWQWWNLDRRRAKVAYASAYTLLSTAGASEMLANWFAEPVELPDNGVFWQPPPAGAETALFRAHYDVSAEGRARNVVVEQVTGPTASDSRLRRQLAATRFRPRWTASGPEAVSGIGRNYLLAP